MAVASLLREVDIGLIAYKQFFTAMSEPYARGVRLVTVSEIDAVETAAYKGSHRIRGAVSHTAVEHLVFVLIHQSGGDVGAVCCAVIAHDGTGRYS